MSYSKYSRLLDFHAAEAAVGNRPQRKVGNNTYLYRVDDDTFGIILHNTTIVKIHRDGTYTLRTGGWTTVTTKDRLTTFSPARIYQENWQWYIRGESWDKEDRSEFFEGVRVDALGLVVNPEQAPRPWTPLVNVIDGVLSIPTDR